MLGLFTDLYELKMAQVYLARGMTERAIFTLSVRRLPKQRNYLLVCGQGPLVEKLAQLRFSDDDIAYLRRLELFEDSFLAWLADFRFTGDIWAVPEGTPVFANEPILELEAPLPQAQILETLVMNQITLSTVLASKASRIVTAAKGRTVVDFAARRMMGVEAAVEGARAFAIAGIAATSNMMAGHRYGIPVSGTMAHAFVQAHENEEAAFRAFAEAFPGSTILIDTYDTLEGLARAIRLARDPGHPIRFSAVRIDSGDLLALSKAVRSMLDEAGLHDVRIFASSGLDEYRIADLLAKGAPIDGFGVGTAMGVAADAPALDIVYKLVRYADRDTTKLSTGKPVLPGAKQIFRLFENGRATGDVIACRQEHARGEPLLQPLVRNGRPTALATRSLEEIRHHAAEALARLPDAVRALSPANPPYPVAISEELQRKHAEVMTRIRNRHAVRESGKDKREKRHDPDRPACGRHGSHRG
ncbi:MAG: nicotinate phosphoribosyltransferase [Alphaproteobacteria bacterium]|nr:MAG: nicotinate phosphoribosyltransferase [Alphaproteobacteria bacterium]